MAEHWTHHDPAVRELIREHSERAWDEGYTGGLEEACRWTDREDADQIGPNPHRTPTISGPAYESGPETDASTA